MTRKVDALNPFAPRGAGGDVDDVLDDLDADSSQTQSLLQRSSSRAAETSPSKDRRVTPSRRLASSPSPIRSLLGSLRLALVFALGLAAGFALYSHVDTGMTSIQDAVEAAQRAKQNAALLTPTTRGADATDGAVISRVREDAFLLRVMTFNLRCSTAKDGANSWKYRRAHVADLLNRYVPAVFGTQEGLDEQLAELQALLARPYERFGEPREPHGEHVQIFYDTSVVVRVDGGTFWLSETPDVPGSKGWDGDCVRIATWCRFRLVATGQEFYHVNTHLDSAGKVARFEGAKVVWAQMQKVLARDALRGPPPMLLTGDFNTFRPSNAFQYLTQDPSGPHFTDAWLASAHKIGNISCTFHEFLGPKFDTLPHDDWDDPSMDKANHVGANHIDFVLTRPPLPALATEVITEAWNGRYPSDHYPFMATLRFPSAAEMPPPEAGPWR